MLTCSPNPMSSASHVARFDSRRSIERYSSKAQSLQAMRHWVNKTPPTISLEFELDGQVYKIKKRFLDKPYAELTLPNEQNTRMMRQRNSPEPAAIR